MQWKRPYAAIGGFGLGLVMWVLEMADVIMPLWLLIILGVMALGMIVFGSIPLVIIAVRGLGRVRIRNPIYVYSGIVPLTSTTEKRIDELGENKKYPIQVKNKIDELIECGEKLTSQMRRPDFHVGQLGQDVRHWLDSVDHDIWDALPDYASYITAEQGDITDDEKLRYNGWGWGAASLRISVDRRLARLRETRSRIQVLDKEGSQT